VCALCDLVLLDLDAPEIDGARVAWTVRFGALYLVIPEMLRKSHAVKHHHKLRHGQHDQQGRSRDLAGLSWPFHPTPPASRPAATAFDTGLTSTDHHWEWSFMLSIAGPIAEHIAASQSRQVPPAGGAHLR
jgi:hypothetical protein